MRFSAILFDLDGTLIDSVADIAASANRTLAALGYPPQPERDYFYHVGDGVFNLFRRALPPAAVTEDLVRRCVDIYVADYGANWHVQTRPFPGVAELLDAAVRLGLRLGVLSNKPHEFTLRCVEHFLPNWRFDQVLGAGEAFPHKPDPAAALHIASAMNLRPADFLYVGDTATDMQTARNAGMYPVAALWGYRTREELEAAGASVLAAGPAEVIQCLQ
jgi:phosphoglycolate phosphatase